MKIAMLQINPTIGDCKGNADKIIKLYLKSVKKGAKIVVAQELAILGYPPKDLLLRNEYITAQDENLERIKSVVGKIPLVIGIAQRNWTSGKPFVVSNSALRAVTITLVSRMSPQLVTEPLNWTGASGGKQLVPGG